MILPTRRAATLAILAAPIAVLIAAAAPAAWVVAPATVALLLVAVLFDGAFAGRLGNYRIALREDCEVGEPVEMAILAEFEGGPKNRKVSAALALDSRLAPGGVAMCDLAPAPDRQSWNASLTLVPPRRGIARVERCWLKWTGPLGLGARQSDFDPDCITRIWPNLAPVRSPVLQAYLRDAQFGLIARRIRGDGTQFEALAEYEPGMDRRRIDWKSSARMTRLYARENESERNNQIVFAFDCGQSMCEPVDGLTRLDRAVTAGLTSAYVALRGGDRVALFGFARHIRLQTPFVAESRSFHRLQRAAAGLDYAAEEPNFTLALASLAESLKRRSLVVLFSDFSDPTSAELMVESIGRLVRHHLVLFVTLEDTELGSFISRAPETLEDVALAVTADTLSRQRALVLERLRRIGVDVIEAPHEAITYRLIDRYLEIKQAEAIG